MLTNHLIICLQILSSDVFYGMRIWGRLTGRPALPRSSCETWYILTALDITFLIKFVHDELFVVTVKKKKVCILYLVQCLRCYNNKMNTTKLLIMVWFLLWVLWLMEPALGMSCWSYTEYDTRWRRSIENCSKKHRSWEKGQQKKTSKNMILEIHPQWMSEEREAC